MDSTAETRDSPPPNPPIPQFFGFYIKWPKKPSSTAFRVRGKIDALPIAVATNHGMDYLLTWNCKHIANAEMQVGIGKFCRAAGFEPPVICTPEELLGI